MTNYIRWHSKLEPDILEKKIIDLMSPEYYLNRELSFIEFNKRVLMEAVDKNHPLLERLKFVIIFSANLDEFFMIRVAGLKGQIAADVVELSYDGMTPSEQLSEIRRRLLPLYELQSNILENEIWPELEREGIYIHEFDELTDSDKENLRSYFCSHVLPVLTPLTLDPGHPFPRIINCSLNIAFILTDRHKRSVSKRLAFLQIPPQLTRLVKIGEKTGYHFVLLEQIIKEFACILFPGLEIEASNTFRVTRDADIEIAEDEAEDLMSEIAEQIKQRRWGTAAVRLEVSHNMPENLVRLLMNTLELAPIDVYSHKRPLNLPDFMQLTKLELRHLKDVPFATRALAEFQINGATVFDAISKKDFIVHHPFDSFTNNVLKYIEQAANDPDVMAIKITLYRTGLNSPVVAALKHAAENGKEVTALVELKARFDEENNIIWAKELERAGVHVVYGVMGLKTHCKIALVVRREGSKLKTYLHLATGNYNQVTARLYTDIGFFTSREDFGIDGVHLFNQLTGFSYHKDWKHLVVAPEELYDKLTELIEREKELSTPDNPGLIFAKMNSLAHRQLIPTLFRASQSGVKIKLLVRGICCLRAGIPGISDNIEVRSILGRFLEHSRVFYFKNGGAEDIYLSSADWMSRNLHKRVELMFPVYDINLKNYLKDLLNLYWKDNTKSWRLKPEGDYEKLMPCNGEKSFNVQQYYLDQIKQSRKK